MRLRETIRDGTLIAHIGASLPGRPSAPCSRIVTAVPLGIAMGISPTVSRF
jgi:taurine transport system permease protein